MDKEQLIGKVKKKRVWMSILSALATLGVLSASQVEWVKNILAAITGW